MFTIQLLASFIVGGLFVAFQTLLAERVRGFMRRVVLTIPSAIAVGLFFIGLTKSSNDVIEVAKTIPASLVPTYFFVTVFAIFSKHNFWTSLGLSALAWFCTGIFFLIVPPPSYFLATVGGIPLIFVCYLIVAKLPQKSALKKFPFTPKQIAMRSILGGVIVLLATLFSKTFGNTWGSLFSAFPAVFSSTLIIYYHLQGKEVIPAVSKSLFFPGAFGFMLYAAIAALSFTSIGIWWGTLAAYTGTFLFFWLYHMIQKTVLSFSAHLLD